MPNIVNLRLSVQRSDLTALETMTKYEKLQSRLEEAEQQILDGEKLRKKLHNTILVSPLELQKLQHIYIYVIYLFSKLFLCRS